MLHTFFKTAVAIAAVAVVSAATTQILSPPTNTRTYDVAKAASINTSSSTIGFADSDLYALSADDVNRELDLMVATGARTVRILMPWVDIERSPGAFTFGQVDLMVDAANARGMSVLGILNSTPAWSVAPGAPALSSPPVSMAAYGDFAATVAGRYKGRVAAYEVWNEPNSIVFWSTGPQGPDAGLYADMLKAAYPKIKAADPSAIVVGGVFAWLVSFFALTVDPVLFAERMYAAGAAGNFDALSFHPYHYGLKFSEGRGVPNSPLTQLAGLRKLMVDNGDGGKKIWATEYGQPTSSVDENLQADFLTDFLTTWRSLTYAGPAYIYTARDRNSSSDSDADTLGVYRSDWTPKPSQLAVRALT